MALEMALATRKSGDVQAWLAGMPADVRPKEGLSAAQLAYGRLPIRSRALPLARSRAETLGFDCAAGRGEPARGDVG
jgi:hypothetical protein